MGVSGWATLTGRHVLPGASRRESSLGPAQGEPVGFGWPRAGVLYSMGAQLSPRISAFASDPRAQDTRW